MYSSTGHDLHFIAFRQWFPTENENPHTVYTCVNTSVTNNVYILFLIRRTICERSGPHTKHIHYKNFFFSYFLYDTVFCRVFVFSLMRKIILHPFFLYSFYSTHSVNTCTLAKLCKIFEGFVERFDRYLFIHVVVVEMQVE